MAEEDKRNASGEAESKGNSKIKAVQEIMQMDENAKSVQEKYPDMSLEEIYNEGKAMEEYLAIIQSERDKLPEDDKKRKYMDETIHGLRQEIMHVYSAVSYLENKQYSTMTVGEILQKAQELRKESRAMQAEGIVDEYNPDAVHEWEMGKQQLADHLEEIASQKAQREDYEKQAKEEQEKKEKENNKRKEAREKATGNNDKDKEEEKNEEEYKGIGDLRKEEYSKNSSKADFKDVSATLDSAEAFDERHPEEKPQNPFVQGVRLSVEEYNRSKQNGVDLFQEGEKTQEDSEQGR